MSKRMVASLTHSSRISLKKYRTSFRNGQIFFIVLCPGIFWFLFKFRQSLIIFRNNSISRVEYSKFANISILRKTAITTKVKHPNDGFIKESYKSSSVKPPDITIGCDLTGGIGNQIFGILQGLALSRHGGFTFLLPSIRSRFETTNGYARSTNISELFSVVDLARVTKVTQSFEERCHGKFHHFVKVIFNKHDVSGVFTPLNISMNTRAEICFQTGGPKGKDNIRNCASNLLNHGKFHAVHMSKEENDNNNLIRFLFNLEYSSHFSPCVFLVGNSFSRPGHKAHEYLYSYIRYINPAVPIRNALEDALPENFNFLDLAVMHLRYDENECLKDSRYHASNEICIGRGMRRKTNETMYWATLEEIVRGVNIAMTEENVTYVYLAASPYVPKKVKESLLHALEQKNKILDLHISLNINHDVFNMIERELAVNAKLFIGDYSGTWSGTVYFKRRSLGKDTKWSSNLSIPLITDNLYKKMDYLKAPIEFEKEDRTLALYVNNENRLSIQGQ